MDTSVTILSKRSTAMPRNDWRERCFGSCFIVSAVCSGRRHHRDAWVTTATAGPPEPQQDLPHELHLHSLSRLFVSRSPGRVMPGIDIVRGTGLKEGQSTPGILREQAFESSNVLMSRTRLDPAAVSGWHHHGTHDLYGFLLSGRLRLEYGTTGSEAVTVSPGDFIH